MILILTKGGHLGHRSQGIALLTVAHVGREEVTSIGNAAHIQIWHHLVEPNTQIHIRTNTETHKYTNEQIHKRTNSQIINSQIH